MFDFFRLKETVSFENEFSPKVARFVSENDELSWAECEFNTEYFQQDLFAKYKLDFPATIRNSVQKRQAEFFAGRLVARLAMDYHNGCSDIPIGENRSPVWPADLRGAISHAGSKAIAVVCSKHAFEYVGVDYELLMTEQMACDIGNQIYTVPEKQILLRCGFSSQQASTLIFSAKESLFKAIYPTVKKYFGFECARLVEADFAGDKLLLRLTREFASQNNLRRDYVCHIDICETSVTTLIFSNKLD